MYGKPLCAVSLCISLVGAANYIILSTTKNLKRERGRTLNDTEMLYSHPNVWWTMHRILRSELVDVAAGATAEGHPYRDVFHV